MLSGYIIEEALSRAQNQFELAMCIGRNAAANLNICIECSIFLSVHVFDCIGQEAFPGWEVQSKHGWKVQEYSYIVHIFPTAFT